MIGRVLSLHRFPFKSMAGEDPPAAEVTPLGLRGDRAFALVDRETGRVVSAKRPKRWPGILAWRATLVETAGTTPVVRVTHPDGRTGSTADRPALEALLSDAFGRSVLVATPPASGARFEYHWPDQPGLSWHGRSYRDEITEHDIPPGTFFDSAIIHLLTTASLSAMSDRAPGARFEAGRFRPNIVIDTGVAGGLVENDWVGRIVAIGEQVQVRILRPCIRCVMVNLEQPGIPADPAVLAAAFAHGGGYLGVKGDVVTGGIIQAGDSVVVR